MRKLAVSLIVLFLLTINPAVSRADCADNPRDCFSEFEDDGKVIPKNSKVGRLYDFPSVKTGFLVDLYNLDILPHLSVEVTSFSVLGEDFAVDVGVGSSRVFGAFSWEFLPIVKGGPFIWAGYNVREEDFAGGIGITILDF